MIRYTPFYSKFDKLGYFKSRIQHLKYWLAAHNFNFKIIDVGLEFEYKYLKDMS